MSVISKFYTIKKIELQPIPKPTGKGRLSSTDILSGTPIPPIDRMRNMSALDFEDLVLEWIDGFLTTKYPKVRQFGDSGDQGRDVVGYYPDDSIDLYQCKHYGTALTPSNIWVELGKVCYYSFHDHYPIPNKYYLVSTKGVGPKLRDLIDNPSKFNELLISNWEINCRPKNKVKGSETLLSSELKQYIIDFDFSIVVDKSPSELINEHYQTKFYVSRFGGGLIKSRSSIPVPSPILHSRELEYTNQLFECYSQSTKRKISSVTDFKPNELNLKEHFEEERSSFYCAESLERFSRDNFPDLLTTPFEELSEDSVYIIKNKLRTSTKTEGIDRLEESKESMIIQSFSSNPLHREIRVKDKAGMCEYLANENKVKWMK